MSFETIRLDPQPSTLYKNVKCDGCKVKLKPAYDSIINEDSLWTSLQALDALIINLEGGDGMLIDPIWCHDRTLIFCKSCAKKLCKQWSTIDEIIHPENYC